MSAKTQAKVLRVLQEGEVERLGSSRTMKVDVRVIAATNKDLEEEIDAGRFREDLYFRLSVIPIHVPPLRERPADIPLLVRHFTDLFSREGSFKPRRFTPGALELLQQHRWRGNIRELRNTVERLLIMARGETIDAHDVRDVLRVDAPRAAVAAPGAGTRDAPRREHAARSRARCASSRNRPSAPSSSKSCATTAGTSPGPPKRSTRRAAISTRSSSSIRSVRNGTGDGACGSDCGARSAASPGTRPEAPRPPDLRDNGSAAVSRDDRRTRIRERHPRSGRKVRTPQGSAPGNTRAGQPDGQWHRKYTARPPGLSRLARRSHVGLASRARRRRVRVKRCGKSAPRFR